MSSAAESITASSATTSPNSALGRLAMRGLGWAGLAQVANLAIRLASNLLLTRLLAPEHYSVFGAALAVMTTLEWLSDLGITPSLVRHPKGDRPEFLLTGWWIGLGRGGLLAAVGVAAAWPLAWVYGRPALGPVLAALALRSVLTALRSPATPLLRRRLNYRGLFWDETIQTVVGVAVSVAIAWRTGSIWAIVCGALASAIAGILVTYRLCPMRPVWTIDSEAAAELRTLGSQVFLNTLAMSLVLNLDRLLGGGWIGDREMGLYVVAWSLAASAEGLVVRACDVYYSMLARKRIESAGAEAGETEDWERVHRRTLSQAARVGVPLLALGIGPAPWAIWLLYDPRYWDAGVPFAILASRLLIRAYSQLQFQGLLANAQVSIATRAYMFALAVQGATLIPLVRGFGADGLALATWISAAVFAAAQAWMTPSSDRSSAIAAIGWAALGLAPVFLWR